MGRRHRLQLLKPNYIPIDCTAEVVDDGLHLLRINGKLLFRFDFEKIHNFSVIGDDKLELEVHMGSGKMGKVKLQSNGHQVMGESPIHGLHSDLTASSQMHPSKAPQTKFSISASSPSSAAGSLNTAAVDSTSDSTSSVPVSHKVGTQGPAIGLDRRGTTERPASPEVTSLPSSSGTWGPGRRPASAAESGADMVRRTGTCKIQDASHSYRASIGNDSTAEGVTPPQPDADTKPSEELRPYSPLARSDSIEKNSGRSSPSSGRRALSRRASLEDAYKQLELIALDLTADRGSKSGSLKPVAKPRKGAVDSGLPSPSAAKYSNPLYDQETMNSSKGLAAETSEIGHSMDVKVHDEGAEAHRKRLSSGPVSPKPVERGSPDSGDSEQARLLQIEIQALRDLSDRRLMALNEATEQKEVLEKELHAAKQRLGRETELQEQMKAMKTELQEAQTMAGEYAGKVGILHEQVHQLQSLRQSDMGQQAQQHHDTLARLEDQLTGEKKMHEIARQDAESAKEKLKDMEKQMQKIKQQAEDAEEYAREADGACVKANEARAALQADLDSAKGQIEELRAARNEAVARAESAHDRDSDQVGLLQQELQMVDQAAARAVDKAKSESARARALQQELDQVRLQLQDGAGGRQAGSPLHGSLEELRQSVNRKQEEVDQLKNLVTTLREERVELEMARDAALAQAQAAHDDAIGAYRRADSAVAEVRTLRERLTKKKTAEWDGKEAEDLKEKLSVAQRESRQHQAAQRVAEEGLEEAQAAAEQSNAKVRRYRDRLDSLSSKVEALVQQLAEAREGTAAERAAAAASREESMMLRHRLEASDAELRAASAAAAAATKRAEAAEDSAQKMDAVISRLERLGSRVEEEQERAQAAVDEASSLKTALHRAQSSSKKHLAEAESVKAAHDKCQHEIYKLRKIIEDLEAQKEKMEGDVAEGKRLRQLVKEAQTTVRAAESAQASAEHKAKELEKRLRMAIQEAESCRGDAQSARRQLEDMKVHTAQVERRAVDAEEELDGLSRHLQAASARHLSRSRSPLSAPASPDRQVTRTSNAWEGKGFSASHVMGSDLEDGQTSTYSATTPTYRLDSMTHGRATPHRISPAPNAPSDSGDGNAVLREEQMRRLEALEAKFHTAEQVSSTATGKAAGHRGIAAMISSSPSKASRQRSTLLRGGHDVESSRELSNSSPSRGRSRANSFSTCYKKRSPRRSRRV